MMLWQWVLFECHRLDRLIKCLEGRWLILERQSVFAAYVQIIPELLAKSKEICIGTSKEK